MTHGTSIAVPQVVGVASLLWEEDLSKSNEFIRQLISYSAKNISNTEECGLLDAGYAFDIYDDFADNFDGSKVMDMDAVPENYEPAETFEYVNDDEIYVEGRWLTAGHNDLTQYGLSSNGVVNTNTINVIKAGAVYPDKSNSGMKTSSGMYHGKSGTNYIASFEFLTEIAMKKGDASAFKNYKNIPGIEQATFNRIKSDFTAKKVGSQTWNSVLSGFSGGNSDANRKYFTWGIAFHGLADTFAHHTYRKSDKMEIVHDQASGFNSKTQIRGADRIDVVPARWEVARLATKYAVECMTANVYGDYTEIDYALKKQTKYTSNKQLFLKKRFLTYAESNASGLSSAERKRFTDANIN